MAEDLGDRTEEASARRLSEARERGQVARSTDFSAAIILAAAVTLLWFLAGGVFSGMADLLRHGLSDQSLGLTPDTGAIIPELTLVMAQMARHVVPFMVIIAAVALAGAIYQVGWHVSATPLEPKWSRLNVVTGFKNLLGKRALVKGGLDLLKFVIVGSAVYFIISDEYESIAAVVNLDLAAGVMLSLDIIMRIVIWILVILIILGIIDLIYQQARFKKDLRMTKQEVKDERKSSEGDMEVKARRMKIARQIAMQRLALDVPKADVIVTNPTHFAVALKYDAGSMRAPKVLAKGADYLALRMRYIATSAGVPIVERPPLARALYQNIEVGKEIFPEHYEAVAEVLAYVYRLERRAAS
jgi:flagellar biosynthetic protein FlhB